MIVMIILLILCLPLILMLSLYTTTTIVSIAVDVPVSGIEIAIEELIELDLDKGESYTVEYVISPTEAKNKNVKYLFEAVGDSKVPEFDIEGDTLIPTSSGLALVTVETVDGGYRDSFFIRVTTAKVGGITSTIRPEEENQEVFDGKIYVGETVRIDTQYYPATSKNKGLSYKVIEGTDVATVTQTGIIRGVGIGTAKIEVSSTDNPEAKSIVELEVESTGVFDFANSVGSISSTQNPPRGEFIIVFAKDLITDKPMQIKVYDEDGNPADSLIKASFDDERSRICYELTTLGKTYEGMLRIEVSIHPKGAEEAVTKSCWVSKVGKMTAKWPKDFGSNPADKIIEGPKNIEIDLKPLGTDVEFSIMVDYKTKTDLTGANNITAGEKITLETDKWYTLQGGYISIMITNTTDGAYLCVNREISPSLIDIELGDTNISVDLFLFDNNDKDSEEIHLDTLSILVK